MGTFWRTSREPPDATDAAAYAYQFADAMLSERSKPTSAIGHLDGVEEGGK